MTIDEFADIYVEIIEPAIKIGGFFVMVVIVLQLVKIMREKGRRAEFFAKTLFYGKKIFRRLLRFSVCGLTYGGKIVAKTTHGLTATLREFWTAKK